MENKLASLLVLTVGKTLNEIPSSLCGIQVAEASSLPVLVAQSNQRLAKRANEKLIIGVVSPKTKGVTHTKKVLNWCKKSNKPPKPH